ncbi:MAG: hypothetical protein WD425_11245 [Nitrospirales bacterium]
MNPSPSSENMMKLGMAFWGSKALLSAVDLKSLPNWPASPLMLPPDKPV